MRTINELIDRLIKSVQKTTESVEGLADSSASLKGGVNDFAEAWDERWVRWDIEQPRLWQRFNRESIWHDLLTKRKGEEDDRV